MPKRKNGVGTKMNTKKILLIVGSLLLLAGLYNKVFVVDRAGPSPVVDVMELEKPENEALRKEATEVTSVLKDSNVSSRKTDSKKLRDLYLDLAKLISLDGENMVIKNTEEIRQANSLAGLMYRLDIKDKYPSLAKEAQDVVVASIGDDQINLSPEIRQNAVAAFNALAWACNEGSK